MAEPEQHLELHFIQCSVLKPGDRVLLALNTQASEHQIDTWMTELGRRFPGVTFSVVGDCLGMLVQEARTHG